MITKIAKIYANAIIDNNTTNNIKELKVVQNILATSKDLNEILINPTISTNQKFEILDEIFTNQISTEILNFIKILTEKKHLAEISSIINILEEKLDETNCIKKVSIISATDLPTKYKEEIVNILEKKLNKKIRPEWSINEELIAGFVVKIDDDIIDTSIKMKLDKIKGNL